MTYQIIALLIWSSSFVSAKFAYTMLDPALVVQTRLVMAALIALPSAIRLGKNIPHDQYLPLLGLSFCHYVLVLMLQFSGLHFTTAASAVTILGLEPLMMVFLGHFFFHDKAHWFHWIFGAMAFIGVGLLVSGEHGGTGSLKGNLLVWAGGIVFCTIWRPTQNLIGKIGTAAYTSWSFLLGAILCLPVTALLTHDTTIHWSAQGVAGMLYLGLGCSWLAYFLWYKGMGTMSANLSGLLTSLEPMFGIFLAVFLLGERLSFGAWIGVALIICSTILAGVLPQILDKKR